MAAEFKIIASAETDKAAADIKNFTKVADRDLLSIGKSGNVAAAGVGKLNKAVANANPTLVNFGRVVQDAPFGILGIANNIDPLLDSFQRLKTSTGSTGAALKSLFAGLAGPAGIAIAVSAVTSSLIAFGPQIKEFIFGVKTADEETKKLIESTSTELVSAGKLISFAGDLSKSINERKGALETLNKEYPNLLNNMDQEQILLGNVKGSYDKVIDSILRRATIKGLEVQIEKEVAAAAERLLEIQRKQIEGEQRFVAEQDKKARAATFVKNAFDEVRDGTLKAGQAVSDFNAGLSKSRLLAENYRASNPDNLLANIRNELIKSIEPLLKLSDSYKDLGVSITNTNKKTSESAKDVKELTTSAKELKAATVQKLDFLPIGSIAQLNKEIQALRAQQELTFDPNVFQKYQTEIDAIALKIKGIQGGILPEIDTEVQALRNYAAAMKLISDQTGDKDEDKRFLKLAENATFAADQLTTLFNASFQAISQGQSPIEAITNSLKGLIVRLAAAASAAALLSALLPGNTAIGSIVAGGGKGFGALFGSLLGLASGGIATRPMPALIGDGGPEAVIPLSQLANIIGGVAMQMGGGSGGGTPLIRGQDIHYINNAASNSFSRLFR